MSSGFGSQGVSAPESSTRHFFPFGVVSPLTTQPPISRMNTRSQLLLIGNTRQQLREGLSFASVQCGAQRVLMFMSDTRDCLQGFFSPSSQMQSVNSPV